MKFTVKQFLEAAEKNGYPWGKGEYVEKVVIDGEEITKACFYGQAGLNLGLNPDNKDQFDKLVKRIEDIRAKNPKLVNQSSYHTLWYLNDRYAESYEEVVRKAQEDLKDYENEEFEL